MKWMLFAAVVAALNSVTWAQDQVASEAVSPGVPMVEDEAPFKIVIEDVPETEEVAPQPKLPAAPNAPAAKPISPKSVPSAKPVSEKAVSEKAAPAAKPVSEQSEAPAAKSVLETILHEADPQPAPESPNVVVTDAAEEESTPIADVEPNCPHALAPPKAYDREVLMLQIFLDRYNFSCGVIDGVWGKGSLDAMQAWQKSLRLSLIRTSLQLRRLLL